MTSVRTVAEGFSFLEGPRWHDGRLWVSDFYTHRVLAVTDHGSGPADVETVAEVPAQPSGLGWLPDGRLLVVSMRDRRVLRREPDGALVTHADLSGLATGHLNDMLVDAEGRAWVGHFGFDLMAGDPPRPATLLRVDPDGSADVVAADLAFPNGIVELDGGATLAVAESFGNRISGFTVGPGGTLSGHRDWARFGPTPPAGDLPTVLAALSAVPDGMCAGPGNTIWMADAEGHRAIRVAPGGEIVDQVDSGEAQVYACALGGPDGHTLYLCTAPSFAEHERRETRAAVLLAAEV